MSNSSKITDLVEDIKETLENSVLKETENYSEYSDAAARRNKNAKKSGDVSDFSNSSEMPEISELFETFDGKTNTEKTDEFDLNAHKIAKVIPTQSAFDEVLKIPSKKSRTKSDVLSDTKEVSLDRESKDSSENIHGNGEILINDFEIDDLEEIIDEAEELEEEIVEEENADMDLALLEAIGIGKQSPYDSEDSDNSDDDNIDPETGREISEKVKSRESRGRGDTPSSKKHAKSLHKIINGEYTNRDQINEIFTSYRKVYFSEFVKLSFGIFLLLVLFYMEIAPHINWKLPNVLNTKFYTLPYIFVNLQILFLIAALNYKSLIHGVKSMFEANINIYSISFLFFSLSFIHTMITLYLRYNNPNMVLFNAVGAYSIVLISLYNILDMKTEITGFKTASSKNPKYALSLCAPARSSKVYRSTQLDSEMFRDLIPYDTTVGGILKTPFISNFFSRVHRDKTPGGLIKYFVYISLFSALAFFVVSMGFGKEKDLYNSFSSVIALMLGSVPLCSFIIESYPMFRAQKKAYETGSAFIGSKSVREWSETPIISLYDRDIFPANQIKISAIKVFTNNKLDEVVQDIGAVLEKLNMPSAETFKLSANSNQKYNKNIKFISISDHGICYASNNRKLFLGTPEYISNIGLIPPHDSNLDEPFLKSLGSIMVLSTEREVIAKVYIKYEITADFHDIIKNIKKMNACLCIRTFDPNIDEEFLSKIGNTKKYPVRVLKLKDASDIYTTPERVDSPIISKSSLKSLINAILIADKTKNTIKINVLIQAISFTASILLAIILGFFGQLTWINSGHLFLLQSFWMLPMIFLQGLTQ